MSEQTPDQLPVLETKCEICLGTGSGFDSGAEPPEYECCVCRGAGFIPTQLGEHILSLVRRHSRVTISAALEVNGASRPDPITEKP